MRTSLKIIKEEWLLLHLLSERYVAQFYEYKADIMRKIMTADLQPIDRARTERNKLTLLFSKRNNLLRKESSLFQNLQGCCKQWWNEKEKRRFLHKLGLKSCQWIECKWRKEGVHSCGQTKAQEEAAILKFLNIPVKRTGLIPTD